MSPIIRRSARARRISIRITGKGEVILTYPWFCRKAEALRFYESRKDWVEVHLKRILSKSGTAAPSAEDIIRAKTYLPERLGLIADYCKLGFSRVTVRDMHTRLGSCSKDKHISLAASLILRPWYLADAVIIHELCHTVHMDHQEGFHRLLEEKCVSWFGQFTQDPEMAAILKEAGRSRARYPLSFTLRRYQLKAL